jgi:hypothetical protein
MKFRYLPSTGNKQALGRVFDKSNKPPSGIWKNQNQRSPASSGHFKTLKELPGFMKEPEGFWEPRLYIGTGYLVFWGSENRGCEQLEPQ